MSFSIETLAIGDEILTGAIADTNSAFVGAQLMALGHRLDRETAIEDNEAIIGATLKARSEKARVLVVFGGLGPTSDDRTVDAVCAVIGGKPTLHAPSQRNIEEAYRERKQPLNPHALKQALYPDNATPLPNSVGMAPGFHAKIGGCDCYFLPGVPLEMQAIFQEHAVKHMQALSGFQNAAVLRTRIWKCIGIFESQLQMVMDPVEAILGEDAILGYRTHFPENHLTLYFRGQDEAKFQDLSGRIEKVLAPWCFARTSDSMEELVFQGLKEKGLRLALAESCTAGLVANRLSAISGASEVLWGGVTVYQPDAKKKLVGVEVATADWAVSAECTRRLAEGIRAVSGVEVSAAITGYLGPKDGGPAKPAGTLFLCAIDSRGQVKAKELRVNAKDRQRAQWGAATHLLDLIRTVIE